MASVLPDTLLELSPVVTGKMISRLTLRHLEYHLALACAAKAASSRHLAFFARFQLVKDSCLSTALLADAITAKQAMIVSPIIM